jgi:acetylglutamate kinase
MIPHKRDIVRDNISGDMADIIKAMRLLIMQRLKGVLRTHRGARLAQRQEQRRHRAHDEQGARSTRSTSRKA